MKKALAEWVIPQGAGKTGENTQWGSIATGYHSGVLS